MDRMDYADNPPTSPTRSRDGITAEWDNRDKLSQQLVLIED
jgi:hypothetical protein